MSATIFLDTADIVRLVDRRGLPACIDAVARGIEAVFRRWPDFDKRARTAHYAAHGVIELMPVADATHYAFKYVNGHPGNPRQGLPTVMAFGVLADMRTGAPCLVADLTLPTAIRTAAVSGLAARLLARRDSRHMALIGNGAQAEFQAIAMRELAGIRSLRLFDTDPAATAKLVGNLDGQGFEIRVCASAAEAADGTDIVTTATAAPTRAAVLTPSMIAPGLHVNAVGGDSPGKTELHPGVLERATVFVEYAPQTRIEGELQQLPADAPATELWRVLDGSAPGRTSEAEVTVFDSVGFALEDFATLSFLRDAAAEAGIGRPIDLVARLPDPRNLFGLLGRS